MEDGSGSSSTSSSPSRSSSSDVFNSSMSNASPLGGIECERAGNGGVLPRAVPFNGRGSAFLSAWGFSFLCSRPLPGDASSVGFALGCGCSVVSGIFVVLWQEKVVAVELVKFDCLLVALCEMVIKRKLKGN